MLKSHYLIALVDGRHYNSLRLSIARANKGMKRRKLKKLFADVIMVKNSRNGAEQ